MPGRLVSWFMSGLVAQRLSQTFVAAENLSSNRAIDTHHGSTRSSMISQMTCHDGKWRITDACKDSNICWLDNGVALQPFALQVRCVEVLFALLATSHANPTPKHRQGLQAIIGTLWCSQCSFGRSLSLPLAPDQQTAGHHPSCR